MMRISQLAERTGFPATTLRFYDDAGLLPAGRSPAGYRLYGEDAVARLTFIGAAKHLGLPLQEIAELLAVWESGACKEVKADLEPRITARLDDAQQRIAELSSLTASLHAVLEHLETLPDRDQPCDRHCGFLNSPRPAATAVEEALEASRQVPEQETERWRGAPVACSLTGGQMAERAASWRTAVEGAERTPVPGGLRLTLPADRTVTVAGLAAAEQRCCPFFDFRLRLDGRVLHLEVRAPADAADLLAELFGPAA
ncbi:MerR family transcriptional regulator [Streptomyces iranensis]|nr:MerR family transcriptional regulator [Streptomyces iranensis]CDR17988.1 MerR family transcriptional regulator [Streptomyces iranensis]